jgi:hypothetical protein
MKWSATSESLRNTGMEFQTRIVRTQNRKKGGVNFGWQRETTGPLNKDLHAPLVTMIAYRIPASSAITWGILHVIIEPNRRNATHPCKDHWPQTALTSLPTFANVKRSKTKSHDLVHNEYIYKLVFLCYRIPSQTQYLHAGSFKKPFTYIRIL